MSSLKSIILSVLPGSVRERLLLSVHKFKYGTHHRRILKEVKTTRKVRVAFLASTLAMWKSQELVNLLLRDNRFDVRIILTPIVSYDIDVQKSDIQKLRSFFNDNKTPYVDYCFDNEPYNLKREFDPQIIFFVQTYGNIHCKEHDSESFPDCLQAYIPYSFWPGNEPWGFDLMFHRKAWRIYYANEMLLDIARTHSMINARNGRVAGYPSADLFRNNTHNDVWKIKDRSIKRIIWAPHFTIDAKTCIGECHSSFFALHEGMLEFAKEKQEKVQIAFKPHPRLKTELYKSWGKEKTDLYYHQWERLPNTQLETGSYIDLFMTSDALIHECGSFMIEYHYSQNPCLYVMEGFEHFYNGMNALGKQALDLHYKGKDMEDVKRFVSEVVLNNVDPLKIQRKNFYKSQLLPPNESTTAQNIYNELVQSLF